MIATARKVQIIADAMVGKDAKVPDGLDAPWTMYLDWILEYRQDAGGRCELAEILNAFYTRYIMRAGDEAREQYSAIQEAIENPLFYPSIADVIDDLPDVRWLWKGWLTRGMVSLLAAMPGTGKSYLALDLARRLIAGSQWPDGTRIEEPRRVIFVDAEFVPSIVKQRVSVWDRQREMSGLMMMWPNKERPFINLDDVTDRERLSDMCAEIEPGLVIVDSYGSATLRGENAKEDVQMLLAYFNYIAQTFDCGLLLVHHLNKGPQGQRSFLPMTLNSIRGSSHIVAMARNIMGMQWIPTSEEPDMNGPRRFWMMKCNVAQLVEPMGVALVPHPVNAEVAAVRYVDAPQPWREMSKGDECIEWLGDVLRSEGPMSPGAVVELGDELGFGRRMIYRARKKLGHQIENTKGKKHPDNQWVWSDSRENDEL